MKRHFLLGTVDRHGIARPHPGCAGNCNQGRAACNCRHPLLNRVTGSELDLEVAPDADRVIKAPRQQPEPRIHRRTLAIAAIALIAFGLLLALSSALSDPVDRQTAAVYVGAHPSIANGGQQ